MRNRIVGAIAASAIAAAAPTACSPANENDSDIKIEDQTASSMTYEQKVTTPETSTESENPADVNNGVEPNEHGMAGHDMAEHDMTGADSMGSTMGEGNGTMPMNR